MPWEEVRKETDRVVKAFRKQVRIPGFRPGKAPDKVIQTRFGTEIRGEVVETLVGRHFWKRAQEEDFNVIGTPNVSDVKLEDGEDLTFKAEFEIIPDFEISEYKKIPVPYETPEVSDEEIDAELERIREQHASYKNLDPRPLADGDIAVVSLLSEEVEDAPPIDQKETTILIGGEETMEGFTTALTGKSPGDKVDFDIEYPEDFANEKLAGKTVPFHAEVLGLREKELPELDDEFSADVGDFRTLDELKDRIRDEMLEHKRRQSVEEAHNKIIDTLAERNQFPVPDRLVEQQITTRLERTARMFAGQGVDPSSIDWSQMRDGQREGALRDVRAGLILERIAELEDIEVDSEVIDGEVESYAKRNQMTLAAARKKLAEEGALDRIESHYVNEKTLEFLFDEAEKTDAPAESESSEGEESDKKDYYEETITPEKTTPDKA